MFPFLSSGKGGVHDAMRELLSTARVKFEEVHSELRTTIINAITFEKT